MPFYDYKKVFSFRKLCFFIRTFSFVVMFGKLSLNKQKI